MRFPNCIRAGVCFCFATERHQDNASLQKENHIFLYDVKGDARLESSRLGALEIPVKRRTFASAGLALCGLLMPTNDAKAGEVGARITKAVTTSDLGIEVRKSVVRGAQVMDRLDGAWERFSDKFNLGEERSKREALPKPRVIPDRRPLDQHLASGILQTTDDVFLSLLPQRCGWNQDSLKRQVEATQELVRKSFERSRKNNEDLGTPKTADAFSFLCYTHFRAYSDILIKEKDAIQFRDFKSTFEQALGEQLLTIIVGNCISNSGAKANLEEILELAQGSIVKIMLALQDKGLIASYEESEITDGKIQDWMDDLSELPFTIGVDGDATLQAQILLQEQGYRLYPSFSRLMVASLLRRMFRSSNQTVSCDEYYMDTDYNSDPEKFEVKQVLLNIVIDSGN